MPYHLGHEGVGMGNGPGAILAAGGEGLGRTELIAPDTDAGHEIGACFALNRALAPRVAAALAAGERPVVLAGNCHTAQATVAGAGAGDIGVVWFDAHADYHTPETSASGFFDGCALSLVTGDCFRPLTEGVAGFAPVPPEHVVLVGARSVDFGEVGRLRAAELPRVAADDVMHGLPAALDALAERVSAVYLHLDLDVLDTSEGHANAYATPGGLSLAALRGAIGEITLRFDLRAAALTAYDPAADPEGRIAHAGVTLLTDLAGLPSG